VLLVSPGSPAEKAGLKAGDELKELIDGSGKLIEDTEEILAGAQVTAVMADGSRREVVAADYF
jgi:S1-C subfamily serine protease